MGRDSFSLDQDSEGYFIRRWHPKDGTDGNKDKETLFIQVRGKAIRYQESRIEEMEKRLKELYRLEERDV